MKRARSRTTETPMLPLKLVLVLLLMQRTSGEVGPWLDPGGPTCESMGIRCDAGGGLMRDSTLGLTEVVWVGPETRGFYVGSPSIWKSAAGPVFASHDFFGSNNQDSTLNGTVQVLVDPSGRGDGGATWKHAGNVTNMYWANLFAHPAQKQQLFLLGVTDCHGHLAAGNCRRDIVISKSIDSGRSWTRSTVLFHATAHTGSYHCAPTPSLLGKDGRMYRAFEASSSSQFKGMAALIISTVQPVTNETNLLDPSVWKASNSVAPWSKAAMASMSALGWDNQTHWSWEEGNAVELADGSIVNVIRIDGQSNASNTQNVAAVMKLDRDGSTLSFDRMIHFPACSSKFVIRRDPASGLFFTLSTDVTETALAQNTVYARNHLVLAVSADIYKWNTCAVLLVDDTGLSTIDSARYTGFHYVDFVFDGPDILYAIRTGYRGANSFHNANRMTVKRVTNYRTLAHPNGTCSDSWLSHYHFVGNGWCRPTEGFSVAGHGLSDSDCAQQCLESRRCHAFANVLGPKPGGCVMYPMPANKSSGLAGVDCYVKLAKLPEEALRRG